MDNTKMKEGLGVELTYPSLEDCLKDAD
jgi:hypothetical protein